MRLIDKVAIVTGGSRGIGRAIVDSLTINGAKVVVVDVDEAAAQAVADELSSEGYQAICLRADVSRFEDCDSVVQTTIEHFGGLDILVNNAGITKDSLLMRMSEEDWDRVLSVNLKGVFNCTKAAVRPMLRSRGGRIVSIASVVGLLGNAGQANYAASKAGVIGFTKTMARELASRGITVNAVAPGFIKTQMTANLPERAVKALIDQIPLGTLGEPEDVARAVLFLCSDDARYVTGQVISVDGGMAM